VDGRDLGADDRFRHVDRLKQYIKSLETGMSDRSKLASYDDPQIIVPEGELETYLQDGWEFVSVLPSQKILIRK
jgi:hypothetical protein